MSIWDRQKNDIAIANVAIQREHDALEDAVAIVPHHRGLRGDAVCAPCAN